MKLLKYAYWLIFPILAIKSNSVFAQVIPDNTLGEESSQVNSVSEQEQRIEGGAVRDSNLFHSFQEFNVSENKAVNFVNPEGVENIFSRVTGKNISQIMGDLGVLGNANLFLLNPNGIVFGEKASLNLNGSFIATTANSINFEDGFQFVANSTEQKPLLTVSIPIGLQFDNQPGKIINQAQSPEKAASNGQRNSGFSPAGLLVESGQTIALIGGEIISEGGNLTASGGSIEIGSVGADSLVSFSLEQSAINFDYSLVSNFLDITLTDREKGLLAIFKTDENGNFILDENGQPIEIFVDSPLSSIIDANNSNDTSGINLIGKNISILNGSQVQALTLGKIAGGNVNVEAQNQLTIRGRNFRRNLRSIPSLISTSTLGDGDAGNIRITTKRLTIENSTGNFSRSFTRVASSSIPTFNPNTGETIFPKGNGGNVFIDASESIALKNQAAIITQSFGSGKGGNINLETGNLIIDSNSQIAASTVANDGGNINLQVNDTLELRDQSNISASVGGNGNGGNLNIDTKFLITSPEDNSDITANAELGQGGNIAIDALGIFGISFRDAPTDFSDITVTSNFGTDGTVMLPNSEIQPERTESDSQVQFVAATPAFTPNYCYISKQNQYVKTGRGGIPLAAKNSLISEYTWEDWRIIAQQEPYTANAVSTAVVHNSSTPTNSIQGWMVNQRGEIILTDKPIKITPHASEISPSGC